MNDNYMNIIQRDTQKFKVTCKMLLCVAASLVWDKRKTLDLQKAQVLPCESFLEEVGTGLCYV